jgi:hypothetical protein
MKRFGIQNIKFFGFICILGSFLLPQAASAATAAAPALKVHLLDNLSAQEGRFVRMVLKKMGYAPSSESLFSKVPDAIIITKTIESEIEKAGLKIELVRLENESSLPRTVFEYRTESTDLQAVMEAFPKPESIGPLNATPVALQK